MKAVIPAAGLGSRFLPATKSVPKEMLPILDKPVIQHVVEEALHAPDCATCTIVNSRDKRAIEDHFSPNKALSQELRAREKDKYATAVDLAGELNVDFVYQDEALGLGHAVLCSQEVTADEPFYVLLGDVVVPNFSILPKLKQVSDTFNGASVIAVLEVPHEEVSRFGVISGSPVGFLDDKKIVDLKGDSNVPDTVWKIDHLVEKPPVQEAPSNLAIFGRYLLTPRVHEILNHTQPGAGNEIQLTDALESLLKYEEMYAVVIEETEGFDTGTIPNWIATNYILASKDKRFKDSLEHLINP